MTENDLERLAIFTAQCYIPRWIPFLWRRRMVEELAVDIQSVAHMYASGEPFLMELP